MAKSSTNTVVTEVCNKFGHDLATFPDGTIVDPATRQIVVKQVVRCRKCTLTPEEIQTRRVRSGQ